MNRLRLACGWTVAVWLAGSLTSAQVVTASIPRIVEKNGRHALLVDGQPFFMLGGQAHNSSAWPAFLPGVWRAIDALHANTLEVPIYWEQIEPRPGNFDFSLLDLLLGQARDRKVHLVLLWFGTWKNGSNHYMPEWMKREAATYPNLTGRTGQPVDSPSPHGQKAMDADARAFTAVMRHLKDADPQHTVLMVQVENEPGSWGSVRDFSPTAQTLFDGPVPAELLRPEVLRALNTPVNATGTWRQVFGTDADEYFHAWSVARYVGYVAAAGKAVNPLPLYVNAALRDPLGNPAASTYESGGPTDNVIPIWKAAAPAIDLLAPDIYMPDSSRALEVLRRYDRPDNALFVPEIGSGPEYVRYLYATLAHGGIGFAPFGIDDNGRGDSEAETAARLGPLGREYAAAGPMMRDLAKWAFEGSIKAAVEGVDHASQTIDLGNWKATVIFGSGRPTAHQANPQPTGKAMIVRMGENEFMLVGTLCRVTFDPAGSNAGRAWQYLRVEEGQYTNGRFELQRIRNGDETDWGGPLFGAAPAVLHVTLVLR